MPPTETKLGRVFCGKCGKVMKGEAYLLTRRPDALRERDGRAPFLFAWHCRCGSWDYRAPQPPA